VFEFIRTKRNTVLLRKVEVGSQVPTAVMVFWDVVGIADRKQPDVSKEYIASIFTVEEYAEHDSSRSSRQAKNQLLKIFIWTQLPAHNS
jgi:hypothetical protein